jgi:phage N-6-adenine-methyltransferase
MSRPIARRILIPEGAGHHTLEIPRAAAYVRQPYMPPVAATVEWGTPQARFDAWNAQRHYTLDVAASEGNAKCPAFFTKEVDGLVQPWTGRVWCNPPYGPAIPAFVSKAEDEMRRVGGPFLVDMLVPARTDVRWFHKYIWNEDAGCTRGFIADDNHEVSISVRFIKGRLKFEGPDGVKAPAPFPSMLVSWVRR